MAWPVYSTALFRAAGFTGDATVSVPAGQIFIVRDIDVYADVPNLGRVVFYAIELPTNATFAWFNWSSLEQNLKMWRGRQVISPQGGAGALLVRNIGGSPCDVSISGYVLTQP